MVINSSTDWQTSGARFHNARENKMASQKAYLILAVSAVRNLTKTIIAKLLGTHFSYDISKNDLPLYLNTDNFSLSPAFQTLHFF